VCFEAEVALEIHGEWQLKVVRDVVITTLGGSWNEEAAVAYFEEYKPAAEHLGRYCTLALYTAWRVYTPEAAAIVGKLRRWAYDHGCVCAAWVIEDVMMKKWIELFLRQDDGLHEVRAFATVVEAVEWLATKGFTIDPAEAIGLKF